MKLNLFLLTFLCCTKFSLINPGTLNNDYPINETILSYENSVNLDLSQLETTNNVFLPCIFNNYCSKSYFDDFSNPQSGWAVISEEFYTMGYENGEYFMTVDPSSWAFSVRDFNVSNYKVEVDITRDYLEAGDIGILFGAGESGFYFFDLDSLYSYNLYRVDADSQSVVPLIESAFSLLINKDLNKLGVERIDSSIILYINDVEVDRVNDGKHNGTLIGFYVESIIYDVHVSFDNFQITSDNCVISNLSQIEKGENFLINPLVIFSSSELSN